MTISSDDFLTTFDDFFDDQKTYNKPITNP